MTSTAKWQIVAAACAVGCVVLLNWGSVVQHRAAALEEQLAVAHERVARAEEAAATTVPRDQYDALQSRLATLTTQKERLEQELAQVGQTPRAETKTEPEPEAEPAGPGGLFAKMFRGKQGKEMAEMSARAALDMQYGGFFRDAKLPADVEQKARDLMVSSMASQIEQSLGRAGAGTDANVQQQTEKERVAQLRAKLAEILTTDELASWDEYEATKTERMLLQQYDMQLGMVAPSLGEDERKRASEVLVAEFMATTDELTTKTETETTDPQDAFGKGMKMQLDVLDRAREKLAAELNEEQLGEFDRFIEQQKRNMRMAATMMGGLTQETKDEDGDKDNR